MSAICANTNRATDLSIYLTPTDSGNPAWPYVVWWSGSGSQTTLLVPDTWQGTGDGWTNGGLNYSNNGYTIALEQNTDPVYTAFYFLFTDAPASGSVTATLVDTTTDDTYDLTLKTYLES